MTALGELPPLWETVISVMSKYLENREDHWTLQTSGEPYKFGPYVQVLQEHDNMLLVEATSNQFLEPPLSPQQNEAMLFLGWRFYPEDYYPNFSQILDQSKYSPREIAELLAKTLSFVYGADHDFNFEIKPYRSEAALVNNWDDLFDAGVSLSSTEADFPVHEVRGGMEKFLVVRAYEPVEGLMRKRHAFSVIADSRGFQYVFKSGEEPFDANARIHSIMSGLSTGAADLGAEDFIEYSVMGLNQYWPGPIFEVSSSEIAIKGERICLDFGGTVGDGPRNGIDNSLGDQRVASVYAQFPEILDHYDGEDVAREIVLEAEFRLMMATMGFSNPEYAYELLSNTDSPQETELDLAIAVSQCDEVALAVKDPGHPCHKVTTYQSREVKRERQLPEPWIGGLATGRVLFVSSNPGISEDPSLEREDFPTSSWTPQKAGNFFVGRFDQTEEPVHATFHHPTEPDFLVRCLDGKYRSGMKASRQPQKTWKQMHDRAMELLGPDADPNVDYAMTEAVHCKSAMAFGVSEAAAHCVGKWMDKILELSPANLIVILGAKSRDFFALPTLKAPSGFGASAGYEEMGPLARSLRDIFVTHYGGKARVVIFNYHPTHAGMRVLSKVYGAEAVSLLREFLNDERPVPESTNELNSIIKTLVRSSQ